MQAWKLLLSTGIAGLGYFLFMAVLAVVPAPKIVPRIALWILSAIALVALLVIIRNMKSARWPDWLGVIGASFILLPVLSNLVVDVLLRLSSGESNQGVVVFHSLSFFAMVYLLPLGVAVCLIAGFSGFYRARGNSEVITSEVI